MTFVLDTAQDLVQIMMASDKIHPVIELPHESLAPLEGWLEFLIADSWKIRYDPPVAISEDARSLKLEVLPNYTAYLGWKVGATVAWETSKSTVILRKVSV
jgi:hypothetical protein